MKKILLITIIFFFLFSCSKTENVIIEEISEKEENIEIVDNTEKEEINVIDIELQNELISITHDNFKADMDFLKSQDKMTKSFYDCSIFILPEADKRPKFQLEIQSQYLNECEEIVYDAKVSYYTNELSLNPEEIFNIKDDYKEEYNLYIDSLNNNAENSILYEDNNTENKITYEDFVL
ncbi:MAG: hypothetical protein P1U46_01825 [Patescibacteria group bacterium]|nr:hypothetical protein [Patescibacteria group bacterium]